MTDNIPELPPIAQDIDSGMTAVLAAWHHRARQWAAVVAAQGVVTGRAPIAPLIPNPGALVIEGQVLPELLIPAAIIVVGDKVTEGQLIQGVALPWFDILKELERNPGFLHQLDWRKVEELIAGAYRREGWDEVILTPRSADGGRDVIASKHGVGAIRFYDQVKAYAAGHKVTADEVRALFGVVARDQNVSKGLVTTTATFAPGVYEEWKPYIAVQAGVEGRAEASRVAHGTRGPGHWCFTVATPTLPAARPSQGIGATP
jgi:restriction system protein